MRVRAFAKRNMKELFRDPLTLFFGLGFPLALLLMMTLIQRNIPVHVFELDTLAPGMALFGLTFMALFSGLLLAKDRSSAFLARLTASPMTASDFLLGYLLPLLPMAVGQSVICLGAAVALGLPLSWNLPAAVAALIPSALLFIAQLPRTAGAVAVFLAYVLVSLRFFSFAVSLLPLTNFWLPTLPALMLIYPGLDQAFGIEEKFREGQEPPQGGG